MSRRLPAGALVCLSAALAGAIACGTNNDTNPDAVAACSDGADNDVDLLTDFPADPGCDSPSDNDESNAPIAQCGDGRDNDGDGYTDYPNDPGCVSILQNVEQDDCQPDGTDCPACLNRDDDDDDGLTDFPDDNGCESASDNEEYLTNQAACGNGTVVQPLPASGDVTGVLPANMGSDLRGDCGGNGDELAYELVLPNATIIVATTDLGGTTADTVLYLRSDCVDPLTELACSDDIAVGTNNKSELTVSVPAGTYYLVVDNHNLSTGGNFTLHVDLLNGEGGACETTEDCGPGLVCRIPLGEATLQCSQPVCGDGLDDDADGTADYPGDPGCASATDADEVDDCPDGKNCPACANGDDDDGDKLADYPADPDCSSASQVLEGCGAEQDAIHNLTMGTTNDDLTGLAHDFELSCGLGGGADRVLVVTVPAMQSITFDTNGSTFDTVLGFYPATCEGEIDCDDDGGEGTQSFLQFTDLAAGTYTLVVSHYNDGTGNPVIVHTAGIIQPGGRCDGALAASGALTCPANYECGPAGTCIGSNACNNGMDDDADGHIDWPAEPGCTAPNDDDETDDCPTGPNCPQCSNGQDDDGDGDADYPADSSCDTAASTSELCDPETDTIVAITGPTTTGTTAGAANDFLPVCQGLSSAPDVSYGFAVPVTLATLTFDTNDTAFDTVLSVREPTCLAAPLACDDDSGTPSTQSAITLTNVSPGSLVVTVDGYLSNSGAFQLHAAGVATPGAACGSPLFAAGVLSCAAGETCTAGTCQP
jgi:large repetitive protein